MPSVISVSGAYYSDIVLSTALCMKVTPRKQFIFLTSYWISLNQKSMALINCICNFKEQSFASLPMEWQLTLRKLPALNILRTASLLNPCSFQFLMLLFSICILAWLSEVYFHTSQRSIILIIYTPGQTLKKTKTSRLHIAQINTLSNTHRKSSGMLKEEEKKGSRQGTKWGERKATVRKGRWERSHQNIVSRKCWIGSCRVWILLFSSGDVRTIWGFFFD